MQLAQKISISLDPASLNFLDRYAANHAARGRSAVVAAALRLLQTTEQENELNAAYAASSAQDASESALFDATLSDGLSALPILPGLTPELEIDPQASHEAW